MSEDMDNTFEKKLDEQPESIAAKLQECAKSSDFQNKTVHPYTISYCKPLIDSNFLHRDILPYLSGNSDVSLNELYQSIPIADKKLSRDWNEIQENILRGYVAIQFDGQEHECLLVHASMPKGRDVNSPEVEFSVVGPKEAFVESLDMNLNLIRKRMPTANLRVKEMIVGSLSKTRIAVCYLESITNEEFVNTMIQRIEDLDIDFMPDITMLVQMIEDSPNSVFPQLIETERPDRLTQGLALGQVGVLMDGSPSGVIGPAKLGWFLIAHEDYYLPWHMGSFFRVLRHIAILFSVLATSFYVAILTYHYQVIPNNLLPTIVSSRINIPFPPFLEVMIMEFSIELLREAGARLPTKVGQTIGIVGGIVLGTAAVEASLTSNILLLLVALSALASFTTPIFRMSNTIRILRFPFIIAAEVWGLLGIFICGAFVLTHLLRLKSLGIPYLVPYYPLRVADLKDSFVRLSYGLMYKRPSYFRTKDPVKFHPGKAKIKKDIDE
ncbi:spore germination protein [Paenibacillus cisolokensis]|uniref:Spore germination protein n=1 Tax=Paenibacillus cisolokensis TaxID=1658519 RepID=A0ABQ4NF13_9BACL|nr:spore germination protein [Paenibacillus cisolokensis]GIQ66772.1 spore germination protein [Paenibacillus cisolokensis]